MVLAAYLRRVRGAVAEPERIVICSGVQQGVNLVIRALAKRGVKRMAFEDPGHPDHRGGLVLAGIEAVPVPVDDHGVDVDALAAGGAGGVVLTPAHQSPTGALLAPERRQALLAWAAEHDATIVEDDYDAEFRYDREPVGTLQGLAPERVATLGSVSKSLAPGLRLGWVVCPPRMVEAIADEKRDRGPRLARARPTRARGSHRVGPLRPPPAPDARRVRGTAPCADGRARPARAPTWSCADWRPGSTCWCCCRRE